MPFSACVPVCASIVVFRWRQTEGGGGHKASQFANVCEIVPHDPVLCGVVTPLTGRELFACVVLASKTKV